MLKLAFILLTVALELTTSSFPLNSTADDRNIGQDGRSIAQLDQVTYRHFLPSLTDFHHQHEAVDRTPRRPDANISSNHSLISVGPQSPTGRSNRLPLQHVKHQRQNLNKLPKARAMAVDMAAEGSHYFRHHHRLNAHRRQANNNKKQRQQVKDFQVQQLQASKDGGLMRKRQEATLPGIGFPKDKKPIIKNDLDIRGLENRPSVLVVTKMANLKKEMCKSEPLSQRIREPGCQPKMITNRFCYGQCNSFYIPKGGMKGVAMEASLDKTAFKSCSFCRPKKVESVAVTLFCPGLPQRFMRKHIQVIRHCTCSALSVK